MARGRPGGGAPGGTWALALATGLPLTAVGAPNVALPAIGVDLGAGFDAQQGVVATYTLLLAALQFASGPVADRLGRRRTTLVGLALFALASLAAAAAPSVAVLVVARGLQGAGGALTITGALALMAASTSGADRLRAVALRSSVIAVSFAIGPLVGGLLVDGPGWRWIFLVDALVAVPLVATLRRGAGREPVAALAAQADWAGLTVLTGGLLAGVWSLIRADDVGWGSAQTLAGLALAALAIGTFLRRDRRAPAPLLPARLLRRPAFQATTLGLCGLYFALFGGMVHLTRYLQLARGESAIEAGLVLATFAATSLAAVLAVTRPGRRGGDREVTVAAFLCGALGLAALGRLTPETPLAVLLVALALCGVASGVVNPLATAGHLATFSARDGGIAAGINSSARQLGTALGTAVLGSVVGSAASTPDALAAGVATAMLVAAGVMLALAVFTAVRIPGRTPVGARPAAGRCAVR